MIISEKEINRLPATKTIEKLKSTRDSSTTVERHLDGQIPESELTIKELEILDRVITLNNMRRQFSADNGRKWARLDRKKLCDSYMQRYGKSVATFDRDLAIVSRYVAKMSESEIELKRASLLEALEVTLEDAIEFGERELVGRLTKEIRETAGIGKEGALSGVAAERIEQHINIYVTDDYTSVAIKRMLEGDVSLHRYLPSLEEILTAEAEYEELASQRLEVNPQLKLLSDERTGTQAIGDSD